MLKEILIHIVYAIITCAAVHEFGHWLTAKLFGESIKFYFAWGWLFNKIPVPRGIWTMPWRLSKTQKKIVALAGFGMEFFVAILLLVIFKYCHMLDFAVFHLMAYPFYSGDASDFKWL